MKKIFLIILCTFFTFSFNIFAQSDSLKTSNNVKGKTETKEEIIPSFNKEKKKKDVFIDRDGDGMSDNRVEGMRFEKMRKRKRLGEKNERHGGKK